MKSIKLCFVLWLLLFLMFVSGKQVQQQQSDDDSDDDEDGGDSASDSVADVKIEATTAPPPPPVVVCQSPIDLTVDSSWLETRVFGDFRIWHIMFSALGILTVVAVLFCCLFRCRIPRTKQEIEADYTRRKITKLINAHLRKIKLEELEYDPTNLLPVLKRVEELEDTRVKKHRSFERRLNWRQKLKRFILRKELSFEDEADDQKQDGSGTAFTKEEMEKIEKELEDAKIDSTAFNVITDQIAILSYFESDKTRKKRLKEEKKKQKQLEKEKKKQEKEDKKKGVKPEGKLAELKASDLEKDAAKTDSAVVLDMEQQQQEAEIKPKTMFSFRGTVRGLMSGLRVGGGSKTATTTAPATPPAASTPSPAPSQTTPTPTTPSTEKPETKKPEKLLKGSRTPSPPSTSTSEKNKSPVREEIVINIGLVRKEFENIPQIEVQEDVDQEPEPETTITSPPASSIKHKWFGLHQKATKQQQQRKPILRMDAIVDKNRLQIPDVPSIKDINVSRKEKKSSKEQLAKDAAKKRQMKTQIDEKVEEISKIDKIDGKSSGKNVVKTSSAVVVLVDDSASKTLKKKSKSKKQDDDQVLEPILEPEKKSKDKSSKSSKTDKIKEEKSSKVKSSKDKTSERDPKTHLKKVLIMEPFEKPGSVMKMFSRESSKDSRVLESIEEETTETLKSKTKTSKSKRSADIKPELLSPEYRQQQEEFAKRFSEHKRKLRAEAGIKKQLTTSSSEIEIPVEHVYRGRDQDRKSDVEIQVHHLSPMIEPSVSTSMIPFHRPQSLTLSHTPAPIPVAEHMETLETYEAQSPVGDEQRKLIIEKTRNVMFDVGAMSNIPATKITIEHEPPSTSSMTSATVVESLSKDKTKKKKKQVKVKIETPDMELIEKERTKKESKSSKKDSKK